MRFHPGKPVPPRKSYREAEPCCAAPSCWRNLKRPAPTPGSAKAECAARKKRRQLARGPRGEPRRGTDAADMSSSAGAAAAAEPLKCVPCDACALGTPEEKDFGQALGARERAEMVARARVIARKIWFLRHAALCENPKTCRLGPCRKAVELVTHMRACGAMADPSRGCRAAACASAARLVHHPRTCVKGAACAVCAMVRQAGASGRGLLLRKDLVASAGGEAAPPPPAAVTPQTTAGLRARAYSSPDFRAFPVPEDSAVDFDSDGFAKPAPRSPVRERSCSSLDAFAAAASPPPAPAVDVHA